MREQELDLLNQEYTSQRHNFDRRFYASVGADVPHASTLLEEVFNDLDQQKFGVSWWIGCPIPERILMSDYLYQCLDAIEKNLGEAKLHYFEWLDARDRQNERIVNVVTRDECGDLRQKMPPSNAPIDDLPTRLEALHLCGFFRAIGSCVDCLGAAIIGVLGLKTGLRKSDMASAEKALAKINTPITPGEQLQVEFMTQLETTKRNSGPVDWFEWTMQYRNMFVHRGRRLIYNQLMPRDVDLYDDLGHLIPRMTSTLHMATNPDKSDVEALIMNRVVLSEDADVTFRGVFQSCRQVLETTCERLLAIWRQRRLDPALIEQPAVQWSGQGRPCAFSGYTPDAEPLGADEMTGHPIVFQRMLAAAVDDAHRNFWDNSPWAE